MKMSNFFFYVLFFVSTGLIFFSLSTAEAQVSPALDERGRHYEIWDNKDGTSTYKTGGIPLWALNPDTNQYQPTFYKEHVGGTKEFRNGYITVKINGDIVSFYDAITGSELRVPDEDWIIIRDGSPVVSSLVSAQLITNTPTKLVYQMNYTASEATHSVKYIIEEDQLLDHQIKLTALQAGNYQLQQKWSNVNFDFVNDQRITGLLKHDFNVIATQKINENVPTNIHHFLELSSAGNLIAYEKTGKQYYDVNGVLQTESQLINFEFDRPNKVAKYHWGGWLLNPLDKITFNQGDTYTSSDPTQDGHVADTTGNNICDTGSTKTTTDTLLVTRTEDLAAGSTDCVLSYVEWDITSIPNGADVTNTVFKFDVDSINIGSLKNCDYNEMNTQPSPATAGTIWTDINDGTTFVDNNSICTTVGDNKSLDLGTSADADVEAQLASNWWAVGITLQNLTLEADKAGHNMASEENATPTPAPTLEVTYTTLPVYVADLLDVFLSSSTTLESGTAVCLDVDLEIASSCLRRLERSNTYRFEIEFDNIGELTGTPNQIDFQSAIGNADTLGSIAVTDILNSGCSTNTDWIESIAGGTTARAVPGTSCAIASAGTVEFWFVITLDSDADDDTSTFFITDGTNTDTSTTTTFDILNEIPYAVTDTNSPSQTFGTVVINFSQPALRGNPLLGYQINYTTPYNENPNTIVTNNTNSSAILYEVSGLSFATPYSFRVSPWTILGNNDSGNVLNVTTPGESFTIGQIVLNASNPDIVDIRFVRTDTNTTHTDLDVIFPNTFNLTCNLTTKFARTDQNYSNLASSVYDASYNTTTFTFANSTGDVVTVYCYDENDNTRNGRYVISWSAFPLLDQIQNFRSGVYGTEGMIGVIDLVTLAAIIISMIGFNRVNESVGAIFSISLIGALAYFEFIVLPTLIFGIIAVVVMVVIASTKKD